MGITNLSVNHLSKTYPNGINVLNSIDMGVKKGELVSIIGPSGCGKTTLFNIISGIEKESSGTVAINGKILHRRTGRFGYMMQEPLLLPWRNAGENIILGLNIKKVEDNIAKQKAEELLSKFHLEEFSKFYPYQLSGGMQQRVALLRTVLFHEDFLLLDEPFGSLDALTRLSAEMWLLDVWAKLTPSIIFITHDVREAILLSDKIYVLSARPASILEEIKIDLPRPRTPKYLSLPYAVKLEQKLVNLLM